MTVAAAVVAETPWRVRRATAARPPTSAAVELSYGRHAVVALEAELSALAESCAAPLTARPAWLLATSAATADDRPWALLARDATGTPVGALVLIDHTEDRRAVLTTLAGTDGGHRGAILTRDPSVAHALGAALGHALDQQHRPAPVVLGPLPSGCPVVHAFSTGLLGSQQDETAAVPVIRRASGIEPVTYLTGGMRRQLRQATNRLRVDGRVTRTRFTCAAAGILAALPLLEEVHRERDHAHGRPSDLDDAVQHRIWRQRVRDLADAGVLELATLHIDDELAAYTFGIIDGPDYRLFEGRFVTRWARYSPGRLLESAVVERALDDGVTTTFDWMTAVAPETLLGRNDADPMVLVRLGERRDIVTG